MPGSTASAVQYFDGLRPIRSSADSYDRDKALDLWETSERLLTHADRSDTTHFGNVGAMAQDRRARVAVAALFLTNGAIFANLLPRYPEIKADLHLSNAVYGAAIAAFSGWRAGRRAGRGGADPAITARRGSRSSARIGIAVFVVVAGLATTPLVLAAALFVAGASDAITDVAQNAHGLRVQRNYGRSIINSFHAVWAVGAILGGLMGAGAIALHIPRTTHLAIAGARIQRRRRRSHTRTCCAAPITTTIRRRGPAGGRAAGRRCTRRWSALVVIAIAGATVEDAGSSWATLYLRDSLGAPGAVAVFGYVALVGFMFVGRLIGDRLVDRFGERIGGARQADSSPPPGWARRWRFPACPARSPGSPPRVLASPR